MTHAPAMVALLMLASVTVLAHPARPIRIAPSTMAENGFLIAAEFQETVVVAGSKPPQPTGWVTVRLSFRPEGKARELVDCADLAVDGVLSVPIWGRKEHEPEPVAVLQFHIREEWLARSRVELRQRDLAFALYYLVDLDAFRRASKDGWTADQVRTSDILAPMTRERYHDFVREAEARSRTEPPKEQGREPPAPADGVPR